MAAHPLSDVTGITSPPDSSTNAYDKIKYPFILAAC